MTSSNRFFLQNNRLGKTDRAVCGAGWRGEHRGFSTFFFLFEKFRLNEKKIVLKIAKLSYTKILFSARITVFEKKGKFSNLVILS